MITKERLEELIEQGATIWHDDFGEIKLDKNTCEVCDVQGWTGKHIYWALYFEYKYNNEKYHHDINIDKLEEDVENGRECLEFGNITRTERLELPSWEDVKSLTKYTKYSFYGKDNALYGLCISPKDSLTRFDGSIEELKSWCGIDVDGNCEIEHFEPLTRENYNEARRLCVKLFKGEEV